jgi:polar amino acid transport system substrate-binding protein
MIHKKYKEKYKKIIFLLLLILFVLSISYSKEILNIAIDRDYPPFSYIDEKGNLVGISVDFWKIWSNKTGIEVKLIPEDWKRAQELLMEEKVVAIDSIFKTPEREKYLIFSKPIFKINSNIYYASYLPKIKSLNDISPYLVGVKEGDSSIEIAKSINPNIRFKFYKNYSDIVISAMKKEINVFLMDDIPAQYYLIKYDLIYKFIQGPTFYTNYLHIATLRKNEKIFTIINEGISKISQEEINQLIKRYMPEREIHIEYISRIILYILIIALFIFLLLLIYNRSLSRRVKIAVSELSKAHVALKDEVEKFWYFFRGIAEISSLTIHEEDFLYKALDLALKILSKPEYGSIFLKEKDSIKLIKTIGHDKNLEGLIFNKGDYIGPDKSIIVKDILSIERKSKDLYMKLKTLSKPIKESAIVPLKWYENIWGYFCLDIPKESNKFYDEGDLKLLEQFANTISVFYAIRNYIKERETYLSKLIIILVKALEYYDIYTQGHSEKVTKYAIKLAERLNLPTDKIKKIYWSAYVHDIGKIFIPQTLLNKPSKFSDDEYNFVKIHPIKSEELLSEVEEFKDIAKIIRHHHERWDGKGYPDGLSGEDIPLESRILAIADAFEAMTSDRPYKKALTIDEAIEEIKRCAGTQFDPKLADIFIEIIKEESGISK